MIVRQQSLKKAKPENKSVAGAPAPRKFVIYHNPRCTKSREALERLRKFGVEPKVIEYLKQPIQPLELDQLLKQMKLLPQDIVRKTEERYIDLELATSPPKTRSGWVKLLADNPVLIERPIITDGARAVLGRPLENVDTLFSAPAAR